MAIGIYKIRVSWKLWLFIHHIIGAWADSSHSFTNPYLSLAVKSSTPDFMNLNAESTQRNSSTKSVLLTTPGPAVASSYFGGLSKRSSHRSITPILITSRSSSPSISMPSSKPDLLTKYALSTTTNVISSSQYLQSSITRGLSSTPSSSSSIAPSSPKSTDSSTKSVLLTTPGPAVASSYFSGLSKRSSHRSITPILITSRSSSPSISMPSSKPDLITKLALSTTTNTISSSQYLQSSITRGLSSTPSSSSSIAPSSPKSAGIRDHLIIIVAAGGVFVILVLIILIIFCWNRRSNCFKSASSEEQFFDALTDEDNIENNVEPQEHNIDISDEEPKTIPLSFQGFPNKTFNKSAATEIELTIHEDSSKLTADVIPSNECSSSNESQNQGDSLLAKNIEHDLSLGATCSSNSPEKEVKNEQLRRTDTTLQTPADTCSPDVYRDSLQALYALDERLDNESSSVTDPTVQQNVRSGNEKKDNSNHEIDEQNCEEDFIVLYPFCASKTDELTLTAGVIVSLIESKPSGWSWVTNVDVGAGWFPSQYLEPLNSSLKRNKTKIECNEHLAEKDECCLPPNEVLNGPKSSPDFVVVHSFFATNKYELTLEKGAVLSIIENNPSGWSWVTNKDLGTGWFPTNYLKPSDRSPTKVVIKSDDRNETLSIKEEKVSPEFSVLHSFLSSNPDELTLEKDAVVSVIENRPSGWSWVTNKDVGTGWFPTYYLKPSNRLSTLVEITSSSDLSEDVPQYLCVTHKPENHDTTEEPECVVENVHVEHQYVYARPDEVNEIKKEGNYEEYEAIAVQASHAYSSSKNNELSFKENETILVLEETDSGWWRGSTYFGEGWFPSTYVEAVSESQDEQSVDIDSTKDASNECGDVQNEIREEDVSPSQKTDLISTKNQQFSNEDNPVQTKQRRTPPVPAKRRNKEEIKGSIKLSEAEPEGIILRTSSKSESGLSKLIKITKRRSTAKPFQSNRIPPPQRLVPVAPPRQFRKQPKPSDLTTQNGEKIEKPRGSRPQIMPRNGKNGGKTNPEITHVPKRPPPPTPEKLEDFHARHKDSSQPTPPQGHAKIKENLNVNVNNTSTKDNVDGIHLGKISEDQTEVNAGLHEQNQNTGTHPKDKDCSDVQHSPNNEDSVFNEHSPTLKDKAKSTDLDETNPQPPQLVPRLNSSNEKDPQTTSPKAKNKTPEQVRAQQPLEKSRSSSSMEQKSSTRKPLEEEPTNSANISREMPTKVNSSTLEESCQKEQPSPKSQSCKEENTACVGEESGGKTNYSSSSPKREEISRPTPRPRLRVKPKE